MVETSHQEDRVHALFLRTMAGVRRAEDGADANPLVASPDSRDALIAAQSARIAELEELEAGHQKYIDIIVETSEKEHAAYEAQRALLDRAEKALDGMLDCVGGPPDTANERLARSTLEDIRKGKER